MTRTYDPYTLRMLQVDVAHQFASGYTGMGNNSVNGIDPDGQVVIAALTGFFRGLFAKKENFVNPNDNRFENGVTKAGILTKNSARMWAGWFKTDSDLENKYRARQLLSRFTGERLQSSIGFLWAQGANLIGNVSEVNYYGGATFISGAGVGGSVSLGNFISLASTDNDPEANFGVFGPRGYTFMHEYGHYLQSQEYGPLYLIRIGLNTTSASGWTERDANIRSANYLANPVNGAVFTTWDPNYYTSIGSPNQAKYSEFPRNNQITRIFKKPPR